MSRYEPLWSILFLKPNLPTVGRRNPRNRACYEQFDTTLRHILLFSTCLGEVRIDLLKYYHYNRQLKNMFRMFSGLRLLIGLTGVFTEILRTRASLDETTEKYITVKLIS